MVETVVFIPDSSGRCRVDILVRLNSSFLVAVRNSDPSFPHPFRRRGELLVELLDSAGVSAARDIRRIDLGDKEAERPPEIPAWNQSLFSLNVPPGTYTLLLEVDDLESRRTVTDRNREVHVPSAQPDSLIIGATLLLADTLGRSLPDTVVPHNYGGDVLFGATTTLFLEVLEPGDIPGPVEVTVRLVPAGEGRESRVAVFADSLPDARAGTDITLHPLQRDADCVYLVKPRTERRNTVLLVPVPTHTLQLRSYRLSVTVRAGGMERTATVPFRVVWPDMPRSLRDVDYALDALRYTATERELDSLRDGSYEFRRGNLEAYWARRDMTPGTAYNEVMTQYYRRVDHAVRAFATLRQPDGFRTDRGRIFVLFGPPSWSERKLDPQTGYTETWMYDHLQRRFVFADRTKTGDYELVPASDR
jgi:GWxTD domain-containing protein